MKKIFSSPIFKLSACIAFIICLQGCAKKNEYVPPQVDCKICKAVANGVEVASLGVCNDSEENQFRSSHADAAVTCH